MCHVNEIPGMWIKLKTLAHILSYYCIYYYIVATLSKTCFLII